MKKPVFWKIIVSLLVLCFFLLIWMNQWRYYNEGITRINKITGKVYRLRAGKWIPLLQIIDEQEKEAKIAEEKEKKRKEELEKMSEAEREKAKTLGDRIDEYLEKAREEAIKKPPDSKK